MRPPGDKDDEDDGDPPLLAFAALAALFVVNALALYAIVSALSGYDGSGTAAFWGLCIGGGNFYLQQHCWRRLRRLAENDPALPRLLALPAALTLLTVLFAALG